MAPASGRFSLAVEVLQDLVDPKSRKEWEKLGSTAGIARALHTDTSKGLTTAETKARDRVGKYGRNVLPDVASKSLFALIWEGLQDKTLIMLSAGALVSLALGMHEDPATGWIEGTAILVAVAVVVLVAAVNDYQKEIQFRKLNAKKDAKDVEVVRDGAKTRVPVAEVVVGDVVAVEAGVVLSVDGVVIACSNLKCDESGATGEPDAIKKGTEPGRDPFMLSGTQVLEGVGTYVVIGVGEHSFHGKTMMSLRTEDSGTPLQEKLEELAEQIALGGIYASAITVGVLIIKHLVLMFVYGEGALDEHFVSALVKYLITGITILVVAVPEGLPLAVTMALAYSMMKMLEDNNLVRHLEACETMGGATNICSDKTGTLTQNRMSVVAGQLVGQHFDHTKDGHTDAPLGEAAASALRAASCVAEGIAVNSTAYEVRMESSGKLEFVGSRTECALLQFAGRHLGADYKRLRSEARVEHQYPFSSAKKTMGVVVRHGKGFRVYVKGAAEIVLGRCTHRVAAGGGETEPLGEAARQEVADLIQTYAEGALRTIVMAYRDLDRAQNWNDTAGSNDPTMSALTLVGVVGIADPVRPEVPGAVRACQRAGIKVRMVTGDNLTTAINIAKNCGIYTKGGLAMEGPKFRKLPDAELTRACLNLQVLARSSPTDKQVLVSKLKEMGEVVAVTGDGTNDGPALKLAHVGFSMGITGTEVAKEASDIVLMDDNFSSIVKAVMWGRNVYDGIRKFLQFQLTVNIVAVVLAFVGSVTDEHGESPLKPVQLLWLNMIMDSFAALALATEPPTEALLERQPYGKDDPLITPMMWRNIIGQALYQLVLTFTLLYRPDYLFDGVELKTLRHLTLFFNAFVMCQVFNEVNSRKINGELWVTEGILKNNLFVSVMLFTIVMQVLIVQYGGPFIGCEPLDAHDWLVCAGVGALSLPVGFVLRLLPDIPLPSFASRKSKRRRSIKKVMVRSPSARDRWKKAINDVRVQSSVVEMFRRRRR